MELRQLRYLDAVARRRSFTRAALDLHIAQSALSQQVGRLERELGVELLRRTTRRVVAEANDHETLRELTARGLGVSLMPRAVAAAHGDRLAIRPLRPQQALPFSLVWRAGERLTPAAQAFREHVLSSVSPEQR